MPTIAQKPISWKERYLQKQIAKGRKNPYLIQIAEELGYSPDYIPGFDDGAEPEYSPKTESEERDIEELLNIKYEE